MCQETKADTAIEARFEARDEYENAVQGYRILNRQGWAIAKPD